VAPKDAPSAGAQIILGREWIRSRLPKDSADDSSGMFPQAREIGGHLRVLIIEQLRVRQSQRERQARNNAKQEKSACVRGRD
jgi:hypothetical protein